MSARLQAGLLQRAGNASGDTGSSLVNGINSHLPLEELRLCVGLNNVCAKCGGITNHNGGKTTGYFSVNRLTSLPRLIPSDSEAAPGVIAEPKNPPASDGT